MSTVRLILPRGGLQRWHESLARRLEADGAHVLVEFAAGPGAPVGLALVDRLEGLLFGRYGTEICEPSGEARFAVWRGEGAADLTFDLTGRPEPAAGAVFALFDDACGDLARDAALLEGRTPHVRFVRAEGGGYAVLAEGLPANERPWSLRAGRAAIATRLITLARRALRQPAAGRTLRAAAPRNPSALAFLAGAVAARARTRLTRLATHDLHWRVGWRRLGGDRGVMERLDWPSDGWTWLPDGGARYFADPFPFEHEGRTYLFCEEYPYATEKAVISVVELDAAGRPRTPRVVLERPYHLSYPLVFRRDGAIWMMPESSGARRLEIYRADPFPDRWVLDRTLLEGMDISDATFFESQGRFWLTAATREDEGSSWDCLSLFSGPGPFGPWERCGDGPALVDAAAARPAGFVQSIGGALWRPAQDCTRGYGSGLALCRIDHVGPDGLGQTVAARLAPPPGAPSDGVHTLNLGGGVEAIDAVGPQSHSPPRENAS